MQWHLVSHKAAGLGTAAGAAGPGTRHWQHSLKCCCASGEIRVRHCWTCWLHAHGMRTHTYTHAHTHTIKHTHTQTHTHTHMHAHTHMQKPTHRKKRDTLKHTTTHTATPSHTHTHPTPCNTQNTTKPATDRPPFCSPQAPARCRELPRFCHAALLFLLLPAVQATLHETTTWCYYCCCCC